VKTIYHTLVWTRYALRFLLIIFALWGILAVSMLWLGDVLHGEVIAFASRTTSSSFRSIYLVDVNRNMRWRLTPSGADYSFPAWSTDRQQILVSAALPGVMNYQLYLIDGYSHRDTQLTKGSTSVFSPVWSPNGQHIAFQQGVSGIFITDVNENGPRRLATGISPVWSPDGQHIVFTSDRDGNQEIYKMDGNGSNQQRLTTNDGDDNSPVWSPDGQHIVLISDRDGNNKIYVMNADGNNS
jgi:TolB protein